jgi:GNAT superfamily N-acetyltransferase
VPKIDVTRTYLEMTAPGELRPAPVVPDLQLERVERCPPSFYRFLYAEVGRPHRWTDRLSWTDDQIREHLEGPITLWVGYEHGSPAGYFELKRCRDGSVEIAYFGLLPEFVGRGRGKYLLTRATEESWALGATRVWLHTCTLDHPAALPNYLSRGFRPTGKEVYQAEVPLIPVSPS